MWAISCADRPPNSFMASSSSTFFIALLLAAATLAVDAARLHPFAHNEVLRMPTDDPIDDSQIGTRWAILIAGSAGYWNYRHQADVCHAYQILRRGGLKEENIVVFMYDDIAYNEFNPRQGVIINRPDGVDVYAGVPKDYTGSNVTVSNLFAVLLGNTSALTGGSGKVVDSGPDDHIFIFYSDHGGPGVLGMPTYPSLFADDLMEVLQKKYDAGGYKEMVMYVEACESGSIFEGLLPDNLNIYVTTAANAEESSWATYCPGSDPSLPAEYFTCLGDLYSVSWMEDSEANNLELETLYDQYSTVKTRTSVNETYTGGSHVMQYGDSNMTIEDIYVYIGSDPANQNITYDKIALLASSGNSEGKKLVGVNQRDADLLFLWYKFKLGTEGSNGKIEAQQELVEALSYRMHLDESVARIGKILFGQERGPAVLHMVRSHGMPLVDDWPCLKSMVRTFELHCGSLMDYGLKHMRAFANICNAGIEINKFAGATAEACSGSRMSGTFNPLGFSA